MIGTGSDMIEVEQGGGRPIDPVASGGEFLRLCDRLGLASPQVQDEARFKNHRCASNARRSRRDASMAMRIESIDDGLSIPAKSVSGRRSVSRMTTSLKLSSGPFLERNRR